MREELAFCRLGPIPHSRFLGWHDTDQTKAIAYERWLADHCRACGQRQSEWRDEKGKELLDPPFELVESVCPSCAWREEWEDERREKKERRAGLQIGFRRISLESEECRRGAGG